MYLHRTETKYLHVIPQGLSVKKEYVLDPRVHLHVTAEHPTLLQVKEGAVVGYYESELGRRMGLAFRRTGDQIVVLADSTEPSCVLLQALGKHTVLQVYTLLRQDLISQLLMPEKQETDRQEQICTALQREFRERLEHAYTWASLLHSNDTTLRVLCTLIEAADKLEGEMSLLTGIQLASYGGMSSAHFGRMIPKLMEEGILEHTLGKTYRIHDLHWLRIKELYGKYLPPFYTKKLLALLRKDMEK